MKRHITAALTISALALASCGTQKEAAEAAAPAPVAKEVNEALNWSVKNAEARYLYSQNMRLAADKVQDLMNKGEAVELIRMCAEAGMEIILMAPEKDAVEIMQDLQKQNFQVFASMMTSQPQYGKYAENITLREYAAGNRVALVLTSSLGEASEFTMSRGPKGFELNEMFKAFGDRLILFPNPAFN